jgi:hypothetical protein
MNDSVAYAAQQQLLNASQASAAHNDEIKPALLRHLADYFSGMPLF